MTLAGSGAWIEGYSNPLVSSTVKNVSDLNRCWKVPSPWLGTCNAKDILPEESSSKLNTSLNTWSPVGWYSSPCWPLLIAPVMWFGDGAEGDATWRMDGIPNWYCSGSLIVWQHTFWVLLACWDSLWGVNTLSQPQHWICAGIMVCCKWQIMVMEWKIWGGGEVRWVVKVKFCKGDKKSQVSIYQGLAIYKAHTNSPSPHPQPCHFSFFSQQITHSFSLFFDSYSASMMLPNTCHS